MIDGGTSDFDGGTFCLTGVVTLLGVARTTTGGGAALLWRDSTASRPLDSITSLAALRKAIKNKSLSNAENWGIDALTLIICCLAYCFGSTNPRAKTICLILVPGISLCGQDPCGCWAMASCPGCSTLPLEHFLCSKMMCLFGLETHPSSFCRLGYQSSCSRRN